jgi:hypothetical protein
MFEDLLDWLKILPPCGYAVRIRTQGPGVWAYYVERHRSAEVSVERGTPCAIRASTLGNWITQAGEVAMTAAEREMVLQRIQAGMNAQGWNPILDLGKTNVPIFFPVFLTRALSPFVLLSDHSVSHPDGFTVSFPNRRLLRYEAGSLTAYIEFNLTHAGVFEVQAKQLRVNHPGQAALTKADRDKIRSRIMDALTAMQLQAKLV